MQPKNKETAKNPYLKSIEDSLKKNEKRKRMQAIGKLGGEDQKKNFKKKGLNILLSLNEKQTILPK